MELRPDAKRIVLSKLNKKDADVFYDDDTDTLYFQDWEKAADGKIYDNLYKLELKRKFFDSGFQGLLKSKTDE